MSHKHSIFIIQKRESHYKLVIIVTLKKISFYNCTNDRVENYIIPSTNLIADLILASFYNC